MQSKTLFSKYFNATLFRKNLTWFWPLWALPSFIGALFPLAALTQGLRWGFSGYVPLDVTSMYYEIVTFVVPALSLCYAVLVALAVWSYLFNSRSVGMMHTLPLRREGMFFTSFLSGMTMMAIPYVVTGSLAIAVFSCFGGFDLAGTLVTVLAVAGMSLFYFSSATLVAFITGNLFAMPVLYFVFHFLAAGLDTLVNTFATGFLFGISGNYSGTVEFLSPTVYLMSNVNCRREYAEQFVPDLVHGYVTEYGVGYMHNELTAVRLENGWVIAVYALVGVVMLAVAYVLYSRRRSESAGDVVAVGWMKPVFRYGVALCGAMAGGLALYAIFWGSFQRGEYYDVVPLAIAMLIAGAIGYYTASMLLAKALRVFRGSWKGLGATMLCALVICSAMYFDIFGVETRVPSAEQIDYLSVSVADNTYSLYPGEDAALLEQVRAVHRAIAEDADYIIDMQMDLPDDMQEGVDISRYNSIRFNYYLKNGTRVSRRYTVPVTWERLQMPGTYDHALDTLVNSDAMKARRYHLDDGYMPYQGHIYLEALQEDTIYFGNREAAKIMEAVRKDIASGACGTYRWMENNYTKPGYAMDYALDLSIEFEKSRQAENGETYTDYDSIGIAVRADMTHTVNALLELGLATPDTLKTRMELYPQDYDRAYWEYQDQYGYIDYEVYKKMSPAATVGIIGGADGPTEVVVTGVNMNPNSSSLYVN